MVGRGGRHGSSALRRHRTLLTLGAAAVVAATAWYGFGGNPLAAIEAIRRQGSPGIVLFVLVYAAAVVAFVPASVLTLAEGAVYGLATGVPLVFAGATLGACAAFLVSRYGARGLVERRLTAFPRFDAIDQATARSGFLLVFLLRLSPIVPFTLLNYALGITRVRFRDYALASVGMLPGTVLYVYSGSIAREIAAVAQGADAAPAPLRWTVLGLGLAATAVVTVLITRIARQALEARIPDATTPAPRPR